MIKKKANTKKYLLLLALLLGLPACQLPITTPPVNAGTPPIPTNSTRTPVIHSPVPSEVILPTVAAVELQYAEVLYYEIQGSSEEELRAQMTALGPVDPADQKPVDAYTAWQISWQWDGYGTRDCDISTAQVTYQITVTMPHWTPPAGVSPRLINKWNTYIQALSAHEQTHINHLVENIPMMVKAIQAATCSTAEDAARGVLKEWNEFDLQYDAQTQHGALEGVVFP